MVLFFSSMMAVLGAYWAGDSDWMQVEVAGYDEIRLPVSPGCYYPVIPFIAVGPDDALHMTYSDDSDLYGQLAHGVRDESGWSWSEVRSLSVVGVSPMVVDSEGVVHICCVDTSGRLRLFTNESGIWASDWSTLSPGDVVLARSISIAVDSDRLTHIAFWSRGDLKYATNRGGHWSTSVILDNPEPGDTYAGSTSIALDNLDRPHIAATYDRGYVGVFSQTDDGWVEHALYNWDLTFDSVSMASTNDGGLYVAYYGSPYGTNERGLTVATLSNGDWKTELVQAMDQAQQFSISMVMGPDDDLWVCVSTRIDIALDVDNLHLVEVVRMIEGEWHASIIEERFAPESSIAIDSNGVAYLAFKSPILSYWTNDEAMVTMEYRLQEGLPVGVAVGIASFAAGLVLVAWVQRRQGKRAAADLGESQESPESKEKQ